MASQDKKPDGSFIFKFQFELECRVIGRETSTVPDMVFSMKDIYERYAVTHDISSLPGAVRPFNEDPDDGNYPYSDAEDMLDVLHNARHARMDAEDMIDQEHQEQEVPGDDHPDEGGAEEERSDDDKPDESGDKSPGDS